MSWHPTDNCQCRKCTTHRKTGPAIMSSTTNYMEQIPGTDHVTCYLGVRPSDPDLWIYSLWQGAYEEELLISSGKLRIDHLRVTPAQVARIVFLLDVEYGERS